MDNRYFSQKVIEWYLENKRNLPWRTTTDPYKIWLSEIILQQTRVQQGLPYYKKFVREFPTVRVLAQTPLQDVLRAWQGLGYYTRARNLHRCAHIIVNRFQGKFPDNYQTLLTLPGVGNYTAAAIASICFHQPVAVVDGNVFRVLARVFGIHLPVNSAEGKRAFSELANALIDQTRPALFNQAVMEFGAMHCTPVNPSCNHCTFRKLCLAYAGNLQADLPVKIKRKSVRKRYFNYVVFRSGNSVFMKKRTDKDIWNGLYDFYLIESARPLTLRAMAGKNTDPIFKLYKTKGQTSNHQNYKQVLTHQVIFARFIVAHAAPHKKYGLKKFSRKALEKLPKPLIVNRFLKDSQLL